MVCLVFPSLRNRATYLRVGHFPPEVVTTSFGTSEPEKAAYCTDDFSRSRPTETTEVVTTSFGISEPEKGTQEAIAIIGMACRFPGGVSNPDEYWTLLRDGVDAITEVPATRWDIERYSSQIKSRYGGFLSQVEQFDAPFFRMAPVEAISTDPQQRILLEVTWEAFKNPQKSGKS